MAELINERDTLNEGRKKINKAITHADEAKQISEQADTKATEALNKSESTQEQLNQVVIDGDSSVEAAQARVDEKGQTHSTLKDRIDDGFTKVNTQLADIENLKNYELNSRLRNRKGHVVFISDDFHRGDWDVLKPIFEAANVPFCLAVVTDWMEPGHRNYETRGTWEQLEYLQNEMGCEVLSHSKTHNRPKPLIELTESELRYELSESRNELIRRGFDVQSFRVPGNQSDTKVRKIAKEFYRAMVVSNHEYMNIPPYETYDLKSIWIDNESYGGAKEFNYYKDHIDKAEENGELLIISMHGYALDGVEQLISDVVDYAKSKSRVTTLREALNESGNIIEVGDYTRTMRENRLGGSHFVVSSDGEISGGMSVVDSDQYTAKTKYEYFPYGMTVTPVNFSHSQGFPRDRAGTFVNYRISDEHNVFNFQLFYDGVSPFGIFKRDVLEDYTFGEWYSVSGLNYSYANEYDHTTPPKDFPVGITFSRVTGSNPNLESTPNGKNGLLITYISDKTNISPGYNYQEFISFRSNERYRRPVENENAFGEWVRDESKVTHQFNNFDCSTPLSEFENGETESLITSDNPNISYSPDSLGGLLKTNKITGDYYTISHQYYHAFNRSRIFYRRAVNYSEWGSWRELSTV